MNRDDRLPHMWTYEEQPVRGTRLVRYATYAALLAAAALLCAIPGCGDDEAAKTGPLLCYVGGTMRPVMKKLAAEYKKRTGQTVLIDSAGSGELLVRIEQTKKGDLYVAHDPFLAALAIMGFRDKGWTVASITPVIVVPTGSTKVTSFTDLAKPGVKVVLSDANRSTAGWLISIMAKKAGITKQLEANVVTRTRGGNAAANKVVLGMADAAICWNATAYLRRKELKTIEIDAEFMPARDIDAITRPTFGKVDTDYIRVTVATLKFSEQLDAARAFAKFLASDDAAKTWKAFGFSPADPSR